MFIVRNKKWIAVVVLGALCVLGGVAWWQRNSIHAWYVVRRLATADANQRASWIEPLRGLDRTAWPALIACLDNNDEARVASAAAAWEELSAGWTLADPRWTELTALLTSRFARLSRMGQEAVLRLEVNWLQQERGDKAVCGAASQLLVAAVRIPEKRVRAAALELATLLPGENAAAETLQVQRALASQHLRDADVANRVCAIRLAALPGIDLHKEVVPLLEDGAPEVRRAAMLAVGHVLTPDQTEVIATEDLLRWLHDSDEDVRRICEAALRGRGLQDEHLRIGRLVTDIRPAARLQVLDAIRSNPDLEPGIWLRTLTHDPAPEVRVAAVRAATEQGNVDLTDRIDQMARSDPSPTVSQLARYYLNSPKLRTNRAMHR